MSRTYYTLVCREKDPFAKWTIDFGDYDRSVVRNEMDDRIYENKFLPRKERLEFHILKSGDTQNEVTAKVADFNADIPEKVEV